MARAFRVEDGHPLDSTAEAAVVQIVEESRPLGPGSSVREPPPLPLYRAAGFEVTGRRLRRAAAIMILQLKR
jgi:hypothetical protein